MLIISVVGRYNMQGYCDRWPVMNGRGLLIIGPCSTAQGMVLFSYWASKPSPEHESPKSLCSNMSVMTWCSRCPDTSNILNFIFCWIDFVIERRIVVSCVEFVLRIIEITSSNFEKIASRIACVEVASSEWRFSHVVFIFEDLEDPLIDTSIWILKIHYQIRAFTLEDLEYLLTFTSIYCGSLRWMRGSRLADYSWAYFKKIFSISERFSRVGDGTLKGQAVPSPSATCKGYLNTLEYLAPKSLFSRVN
jgi:hypothetical protein